MSERLEDIAAAIWGQDLDKALTRTINVHTSRLRHKLSALERHLCSFRGKGYGLFDEVPDSYFYSARGQLLE